MADGVATVDGKLEHRTAVQIAEQLILSVTGVVGVHNNLEYVIDDTTSVGM
ncbi:MAG: hypothetical protein ACJ72N_08095 [Labedaea sp.]